MTETVGSSSAVPSRAPPPPPSYIYGKSTGAGGGWEFPRSKDREDERKFQAAKQRLISHGEDIKQYTFDRAEVGEHGNATGKKVQITVYSDFTAMILGENAHAGYMSLPGVQELPDALKAVFESWYGDEVTGNYEFANNGLRNPIYHIEQGFDPKRWSDKDWGAARVALDEWAAGLTKTVRRSDGTIEEVPRFSWEDRGRIQPQDMMVYCILKVCKPYCEGVLKVAVLWELLGVDMNSDADSELQRILWEGNGEAVGDRDSAFVRSRVLLEKWGAQVGVILAYRNAYRQNAGDVATAVSEATGDRRFMELVAEFVAKVDMTAENALLGEQFCIEDLVGRVSGQEGRTDARGPRAETNEYDMQEEYGQAATGAAPPIAAEPPIIRADSIPDLHISPANRARPSISEDVSETSPPRSRCQQNQEAGDEKSAPDESSLGSLVGALGAVRVDDGDSQAGVSSLADSHTIGGPRPGLGGPQAVGDGRPSPSISLPPTCTATAEETMAGNMERFWKRDLGDGMEYEGERNEKGEPHGQGRGYSNWWEYEGGWRNGRPGGFGTRTSPAGVVVYTGEWKDGEEHGRGTYTYVSGAVYEGEWKHGKMQGHGAHTYAGGAVYDGEWKDGKKHGRGTCTVPTGDVYHGEWEDGKQLGHGTFTLASGDVYVGEMKDGKQQGRGTYTHASGTVYEGEWKDGKEHGRGTHTQAGGGMYGGEWKDGKRHGRGTQTYPDGVVYEGEWKDGEEHGRGTFTRANGDVYEGEMKEGKPHGRGTCTLANGDVYEGEMKDGKQHGRGAYSYANGDVYEGEWKDGKEHGRGTYTHAETGIYYEGEWKDGKKHGRGTYTYDGGEVYEGEWKDGKKHGRGELRFTNGLLLDGVFEQGELQTISRVRLVPPGSTVPIPVEDIAAFGLWCRSFLIAHAR